MTYYGKEPEEGVVTDLSDWCADLRNRLATIEGMIRRLPGGWATADRISRIVVGPPCNPVVPRTVHAAMAQAKSLHGDHERWPEVERQFVFIEDDLLIYTAVARLLADSEGA